MSIFSSKMGPKIIGVVDSTSALDNPLWKHVDALEVRLDLIEFQKWEPLLKLLRKSTLPLLGTYRETSENKDARVRTFGQWMSYFDAVDIEYDLPSCQALLTLALHQERSTSLYP